MDNGIMSTVFDVALRSLRMAPVRSLHITPPLKMIVQSYRTVGRREDDRARYEILRRRARKILRPRRPLGDRHVLGRVHEARELLVRDLGLVHPKTLDVHPMPGLRVRELIGAHPKLAVGYPDHTVRRRAGR